MSKWSDKPWERQKGESDKAFEAFSIYRDMGADRSLRAVGQKLGKSRALMERWSVSYKWLERVRAYENELEKEAREQAIKDRKEMIRRHIGFAKLMQKKAQDALRELSVEDMSPKEIREYIRLATDLERLTRSLENDSPKDATASESSLADSIMAAYQKRMEGNGGDA